VRHPKQELEDFGRFEEILKIFTKEGFGFILDEVKLTDHVPISTRVLNHQEESTPERLRETLEELGTTYIKFGQILAERPDMIPKRYAEELQKLQDSVPPFSSEQAVKIVEDEIGMENFSHFEKEPIAAASIAQVHKAKLESGEEVIVKVRRPRIKQKVEKDLDILNYLAKKTEKHLPNAEQMEILKFVRQFSKWTKEELNLEKEGLNAQIFKENMSEEEEIKVPEVYPELTTEKVLVMEYVEGTKCTEKEKLKELDIDKEKITQTAIRAGLRQSMVDGFFHADPHPSNFLISDKGKIIYLDFGMMGKISKDKSEKLGLMLLYMIREDVDSMMDVLEDIGSKTDNYNREAARNRVEEKVLILKNSNLKQNSITRQMFDLFVELAEEGLHMPSNLALIGKSLVTMEGIGLTIYPEFEITEEYEKMVEEILKQENTPEEMTEDFAIDLIKNKDLFTKLPTKLNKKLNSESSSKIEILNQSQKIDLLPITLILSSSVLILGSTIRQEMLYIGIVEFLIGLYLYRRKP